MGKFLSYSNKGKEVKAERSKNNIVEMSSFGKPKLH